MMELTLAVRDFFNFQLESVSIKNQVDINKLMRILHCPGAMAFQRTAEPRRDHQSTTNPLTFSLAQHGTTRGNTDNSCMGFFQ